ncbi:hypothetical protein [Erythrobacter litoralis]|uniref:Uncharacterized protein n=1 Tax=Erythrobacter litoralis (strain HTCC2594) TaxID=314225 RepID=Q2N9W9_ERYLH|nr:hypothetical protein [Erythrobacter litoralis]ABC63522.1 hypothetical protein ELI_07150 [Erythrobacter litoralis HTCC2594]
MNIGTSKSKLVVVAALTIALSGCFATNEDCETAETDESEESSDGFVLEAETHPDPAKEIAIGGDVFELDSDTDHTTYGRIWTYRGRHMLNGQMYDIFTSDDGFFDYGCITNGEYTSGAPCIIS